MVRRVPAWNKLGRITTAGVITEYSVPTGGSQPLGVALGPDGNIWFTEDKLCEQDRQDDLHSIRTW